MRSRVTLIVVIVSVIALTALVLAGCGSSDTTATTAPPETGGSTTETSATEGGSTTETSAPDSSSTGDIPIGFLTSYTGELGAYGKGWANGGQMAVDDINAAGGVLGRKLAMFTQDDQSAVEQGIKGARTLIGVNNVVSISGVISDVAVGVYPVCKDNKVVLTSQCAGTTRMDTGFGDWFFRTAPSDSFDGQVAAKILLDRGVKKIALMYENDESRLSIANAMVAAFEAGGGEIVDQVAFSPGQASYSAELINIAKTNPAVVWLGAGQQSGAVLFKNAKQAGYTWQWMVASDLCVPELFDQVGADVLEGTLSETPSADTSLQYVKDWNDRYQGLFNTEPTGAFQANSYDQIVIIALAMQKAGVASGEAIAQNYHKVTDQNPSAVVVHSYAEGLAALEAGKEIKYEGISGPCVFDANGNTVGSYTELIAKDGKWTNGTFYPAADFLK